MHSYLKAIDESNWLKHIKAVVETSVFIANVSKFVGLFLVYLPRMVPIIVLISCVTSYIVLLFVM